MITQSNIVHITVTLCVVVSLTTNPVEGTAVDEEQRTAALAVNQVILLDNLETSKLQTKALKLLLEKSDHQETQCQDFTHAIDTLGQEVNELSRSLASSLTQVLNNFTQKLSDTLQQQQQQQTTTPHQQDCATSEGNIPHGFSWISGCNLYKCQNGSSHLIPSDGVYGGHVEEALSGSHLSHSSMMEHTLTNVAFNKLTLPTEWWDVHKSSWAVDNDLNSQFHSKTQSSPWWSVDLGAFYFLRTVTVQPTIDVASRFRGVKIYAGSAKVTNGDFSHYTPIANFPGPYDGIGRLTFPVAGGLCARYVAIKGSVDFLNLKDVEVWA